MSAVHKKSPANGPPLFARLIAGIMAAIGAGMLFLPPPDGIEPNALKALGLVFIAVAFWATEVLPPHVTSFLFFLLAVVLHVAEPSVVFSGFHAGAVWLIFGGIVLGIAVQRTGLGIRMAEAVLQRTGHSYRRVLLGVALAAFGLAFVMPSAMSRVVLLVPIVAALADRMGYEVGSSGRDGMILAAAFSTVMSPMGLLPATVPNVVMSGLIESIYGVTLRYGEFFLLNMPVAGFLSFLSIVALVILMFRSDAPRPLAPESHTAMSKDERRLTVLLILTLALWATDTLHGIAPAWVAFGAAVICLLPIAGLVPPKALSESVNYAPWFFTAGIIGLGAVVADSGLAKTLGSLFIDVSGLSPDSDAYNFGAILGMGSLMSLAANPAGAAAVLTPLAPDIAAATGWPLKTAMLSQVTSFMVILLPYQVAPVLTAMLLGQVNFGRTVRMCLAYTAIYVIVITPLNFLWWRWLGMFSGG